MTTPNDASRGASVPAFERSRSSPTPAPALLPSLADVELAEIAEAASKATPGPWRQTRDIKRGVKLWGADGSPLFASIAGVAHSTITPEDPVPQWQKDCDFVRACTPARIASLVADARRGRADTARLDWLEQEAKRDESVTLGWSRKDHDYDEFAGRSVVWPESFWVGDETAIDPPHSTIREAIEAARESGRGGVPESTVATKE
jgi:hypothetical protein